MLPVLDRPDDWTFWLRYLESGFEMIDSKFKPAEEIADGDKESLPKPDFTVVMMKEYIDSKIATMEPQVKK